MATVKIIGGEKLAAFLRESLANVSKATELRVGFLGGATYPDGTNVATVAALNEFGVPSHNQPPRPFFRQMVADKQAEWPAAAAQVLKATNYDTARTLDQVGAAIAGQLRAAIVTFDGPALAPSTVKAKGFSKQLIDTGVMSNSVDHVVSGGNE